MAVAARAGSASPLCEPGVQARHKGKDPPRLGSPRALCKNWRQRARLSCSRAAGSRPSRDGISQLRRLLALWDSTKATQTPQCGGYRAGVVCHRRAPRFDRRRGCSRAVEPLESRRGDLPTPRLSTLFSLAVNVVTYQPSLRAPRRRPYRRRGRAPSSVVRAGRAAGPTQPAASEHFPADPRQRAGQLRARHGSSGWDVGLHNPALSTVA